MIAIAHYSRCIQRNCVPLAVPDAPTASLMSEFYQNLQKNPDKAQALRQAMLATMKEYPDPKNWAAFTLIGEAN